MEEGRGIMSNNQITSPIKSPVIRKYISPHSQSGALHISQGS